MEILENSSDLEKYVQSFYSFLDMRKLNRSSERNAILRAVFDFDKCFTADALQNKLKEQKYSVSRSTLYATLLLLIDAGLVCKHHLPDRLPPQYERCCCPNAHNRIHIEGSEEMIEFFDDRIDEIRKEIEKKYAVNVVTHTFTVHCKKK